MYKFLSVTFCFIFICICLYTFIYINCVVLLNVIYFCFTSKIIYKRLNSNSFGLYAKHCCFTSHLTLILFSVAEHFLFTNEYRHTHGIWFHFYLFPFKRTHMTLCTSHFMYQLSSAYFYPLNNNSQQTHKQTKKKKNAEIN